jgi:hypothetical protein
MSRNRTNTITRGMLVLLVDRKKVLLDSSKSKLKNNPNKLFITENLTTRRRKIMDELNYLRTNRKISACWSTLPMGCVRPSSLSVIGTSRLLLHISSTILSVFILCTFLGSGHGTL